MPQRQIIVRLLSSQDHNISKKDLLSRIRSNGTDRYDKDHPAIFNEYYAEHHVDFFGTLVDQGNMSSTLKRLKSEFAEKTKGDRSKSINPDIAILYKIEACEMIPNVYEGVAESDCFRFKSTPKKALEDVIEI